MLGDAIGRLKSLPGAERAAAAEKFIAEIEANATGGAWKATRMPGANGSTVWSGETHSLVIDAEGNMFKGVNGDVGWGVVEGKPGVTDWSRLLPVR
jgi:hypothetical protein